MKNLPSLEPLHGDGTIWHNASRYRMNRVSIAYRPMKRNCEISIDGEPISEYSDISQFETKDLHTCAIRFIQAIDDELGENYILSVSGHPFQIELLRAVAKNSPYCSDMITEEVFSILPVDEELSFLDRKGRRLRNEYQKITGNYSNISDCSFPRSLFISVYCIW